MTVVYRHVQTRSPQPITRKRLQRKVAGTLYSSHRNPSLPHQKQQHINHTSMLLLTYYMS